MLKVIRGKDSKELINFIIEIKHELSAWRLIEVRVAPEFKEKLTVDAIEKAMQLCFEKETGQAYRCNESEILALIKSTESPKKLVQILEKELPEGACEIKSEEVTLQGLSKIEVMLMMPAHKIVLKPNPDLIRARKNRFNNVAFIAEDDAFMRKMAVQGMKGKFKTILEFENGKGIVEAYEKENPDVIFLDIHLPYKSGIEILGEILSIDPDAYIVMFSADKGKDSVVNTSRIGAKGFLAKPFKKENMQAYIDKCETIQ